MAGNKYLQLQSGSYVETAAIQTSAGAADAGKIAALDSSGKFDASMLPAGGATAFSALTSATNTAAAMVVGTGASLAASGSGTIAATSCTGNAATLTTPRAIYGNNFDGSAALTQVIASTYGGTGNGFTKIVGPTTAEKTITIPDANMTITAAAATVLDDTTVAAMVDTLGGAASTGTGGLVRKTNPTLAGSPFLGAATASSLASSGTILGGTVAIPSSSQGGAALRNANSVGPCLFSCGSTTTNAEQVRYTNGNGDVGGVTTNGSATSFNTSSDEAFKLNVRPIDDAGEIIDALELRKYEWNSYEGDTGYGVIAQDAYKIFPQAISVGTTDPEIHPFSDEYQKWGADYSKFVPLLLADAQKNHALIKELFAEIADLKAKLA